MEERRPPQGARQPQGPRTSPPNPLSLRAGSFSAEGKALQLPPVKPTVTLSPAFSIPLRIDISATKAGLSRSQLADTFSIPLRIDISATSPRSAYQPREYSLSVSLYGSISLQRSRFRGKQRGCGPFSIPLRINISATTIYFSAIYSESDLSVSLYGSISLQPNVYTRVPCMHETFQYPSTDRYLCNAPCVPPCKQIMLFQYPSTDRYLCNLSIQDGGMPPYYPFSIPLRIDISATVSAFSSPSSVCALSVSLYGSISLQQQSRLQRPARSDPFSIPKRIDISATCALIDEFLAFIDAFQYPETDRYLCNGEPRIRADAVTTFQYPETDRYLCNTREGLHRRGS